MEIIHITSRVDIILIIRDYCRFIVSVILLRGPVNRINPTQSRLYVIHKLYLVVKGYVHSNSWLMSLPKLLATKLLAFNK